MKIEFVFASLLLAGGFVIVGLRRGSERGGVCGLCECVCLFWQFVGVRWVFGLDRWDIEGVVCVVCV